MDAKKLAWELWHMLPGNLAPDEWQREAAQRIEAACSQTVAPGRLPTRRENPEKCVFEHEQHFAEGWNACLDEIEAAPPAVSTPRCPPVEEIARVIYERAFDCRWADLWPNGAERALWLAVAENVADQFFQPDSQSSPEGERK